MYKDEMIKLHQFLVYVLKFIAENDQIQNDCSEYISLRISPHHIHKTKSEHKHAIFVLCKIIARIINSNNSDYLPESVCNSLNDLIIKTLKEIQQE